MDVPLCPCQVVIPLDYNPDREGEPPREVEQETINEFLSMFNRQFNGFSILGVMGVGDLPAGCWQGQRDRSLRVEVAVPKRRIKAFEAIVHAIGVRLGQKAMYYVIGPPGARIMTIQKTLFDGIEEGGRSHGD